MHAIMKPFAVLATFALVAACAANRAAANVDATADPDKIETVHVSKLAPDGRGINVIIADKFKAKGLNATAELEALNR